MLFYNYYWLSNTFSAWRLSCNTRAFLWCHKHCCETTSICPQRGCQADLEQEVVRPYHSCFEGPNSTGFPFASGLSSRSRSLSATPSMIEVRLTSAAPAILSGRSTPGLICGLLCGATWLCLEPKPVASGLEVSVSPDQLFGTHCPRTIEFRWNVSNICWKHIYFAKHMPSSAHSAFVTWLGCVVHLHLHLQKLEYRFHCLFTSWTFWSIAFAIIRLFIWWYLLCSNLYIVFILIPKNESI